jgi:DNA-binding NtrC family response regulator
VVDIKIPSLRERPEDIPLLVNHFLRVFRSKRRKPITQISPSALSALRKYSFPGNVRELENAIEHAFVMCHGDVIELEHLPAQVVAQSEMPISVTFSGNNEKEVIMEVLRRHKGNRTQAARELGMHRSTLWRKLKSFGLVS